MYPFALECNDILTHSPNFLAHHFVPSFVSFKMREKKGDLEVVHEDVETNDKTVAASFTW